MIRLRRKINKGWKRGGHRGGAGLALSVVVRKGSLRSCQPRDNPAQEHSRGSHEPEQGLRGGACLGVWESSGRQMWLWQDVQGDSGRRRAPWLWQGPHHTNTYGSQERLGTKWFSAHVSNVSLYLLIQQFHFWIYNPNNWKQGLEWIFAHPCSQQRYSSQKVEAPQVYINRWMDKQDVVYAYYGILSSLKRKEILRHATTWMNLKDIVFSERARHKRTHIMILLSWGT